MNKCQYLLSLTFFYKLIPNFLSRDIFQNANIKTHLQQWPDLLIFHHIT